ncbi:lytic transglycosylase domain-containing protein [Dyella marensis]|uniref:lytic transglycosylase domain-containing protein n=1 Tax=Dyella TaxID=231454 RepID=UPI0022AFB2FD|nr:MULTISPECIES: lytic transglycosylase domain-containing protein [Dyella]
MTNSESPYDVSPQILARVQQVESGGNPDAVSPKGATGLLQVMPSTAASAGFGIAPSNGTPRDTYRVGQQYLGALTNKYGTAGGLAAYNWGPGNWDKALATNGGNTQAALASAPAETQNYVPKVLELAGRSDASSDANLPPGRISFQTPSKTINAEDEKYAKLLKFGVPQPAALEAAYGVKP